MTHPLQAPSSDDKLWAGLGYAGLVCCMVPTLVFFFLKKDESSFTKFHLIQALGFGLIVLVLNVVLGVLGSIPGLVILMAFIYPLLMLAMTAYWIFLMIRAFTGKEVRVPMLADWIDANFMAP